MEIVKRLKQYMEYIGMPSTQFADVAKVSRPTISQILNGRNRKISNELIEKIHVAFPTLNIMWLLFGDGDIELKANTQTSEPQKVQKSPTLPFQIADNQRDTQQEEPNQAPQISLRTSNIEEFVEENANKKEINADFANPLANLHQITTQNSDAQRKIQSIMVFYNDSSFEIFTPST